ncbi:hypothetical protein [Propylenella binzhouense]|uniref:Phage terminase small subunit P27 family n=1 Tax=Propylenella binzhouense TaxID=2555902 RepID=A0A964T2T2_9HYPH|nr:hypothetical protein [Propylenella binzhouense]MYZ47325.1 hypothetical protein [Propylenella binzhouense]
MKRGRKSSAELAVITPLSAARPSPPGGLTNQQAAVWREVVQRLPADWFPRETHKLLAEYCRAATRAAFIGAEIDRYEPEWIKAEGGIDRLAKLTATLDRHVRMMTALARALRITNQSRLRPETAARRAEEMGADYRPPWLPE